MGGVQFWWNKLYSLRKGKGICTKKLKSEDSFMNIKI